MAVMGRPTTKKGLLIGTFVKPNEIMWLTPFQSDGKLRLTEDVTKAQLFDRAKYKEVKTILKNWMQTENLTNVGYVLAEVYMLDAAAE